MPAILQSWPAALLCAQFPASGRGMQLNCLLRFIPVQPGPGNRR